MPDVFSGLIQSSFKTSGHGNFEAVIRIGDELWHYWRDNSADGNPWLRSVPILDSGPPLLTGETVAATLCPQRLTKICQLTGEYDLEGWAKLVPSELSSLTPAVASHQQHLFIGWKGRLDNTLSLMVSALAPNQNSFDTAADDLGPFGGKRVVSATSTQAPALCSHAGRLYLAWTGLSDHRLNVAPVSLFGNTSGGLGVEDLDLTKKQDVSSDVYFALSTWNPYQVVLMKASLLAAELPALLVPERFQSIRWARRVVSLTGGGMPDEDPQAVLGPPDGAVMVIRPGTSVAFGEFGVEPAAVYPGLPSLFTAARITWGDPVRLETFARADIVAFERNGFGPVSAGGWESCDWLITGDGASVAISWDWRTGAGRDDHIVANGNIRGADYRAMFGMNNQPPEVPIADEEIMSYLMLSVPEVDTAAADFTITVTGRSPGAGEAVTPDIDVIGVLPRLPGPAIDC